MRKPYIPKNADPNNDLSVYDTGDRARPAGGGSGAVGAKNQRVAEWVQKKAMTEPEKYEIMKYKTANKMTAPRSHK